MIGKQIEEENEKAKNFLDRKNHFIALLEQKIDERFKQEAQIREEIGNKLISVIEDKFNSLKIEISKESGNRFECIENLKSYLENDVPKLNEMLNNEKIKREEGDDSLDKKTTEEIMKVQDVIASDIFKTLIASAKILSWSKANLGSAFSGHHFAAAASSAAVASGIVVMAP